MTILILGLIGFISVHMIRVIGEDWRTAMLERIGNKRFKMLYSIISLVSFALMVWGYAIARQKSSILWQAPAIGFYLTAVLMLLSMVLLAGFHMQRSHLSVKLRHPMLWSVVLLCVAHLLVNGRAIDALLFGSLLVWSVLCLISCYRRDARYQVEYPSPVLRTTFLNLALGVVFYAVFTFLLHAPLIGVSPIPQ
ncbi:MAG: NnrU family protein [Granulosicoccus sp.]